VVDVAQGLVLGANAEARAWFGGDALVGMRLDRAMPAMERLAAMAGGQSIAPDPVQALLFWTQSGPKQLACRFERLAGGVNVLLTTADPAPGRAVERTAPRRSRAEPPTTAPPSAASPPRTDVDTLREIARRIREGRTTQKLAELAPTPTTVEPEPLPAPAIDPAGPAAVEVPAPPPLPADHAKLAHELRTPLSAIAALAEIMHDERLGAMGNARYKGYARDIQASARHALSVISAMLSVEPVTPSPEVAGPAGTGTDRLDFIEIDIGVVIAECVAAMTPIAAQAGLTLGAGCGERMPRLIADRRALKQILLNLLANAIRFTPRGGQVTVSSSYVLAGPVRVEVRDTGSGMSEAEIGRIFSAEPGMARRDGERSGFGLPLVISLADANGASVAIGSTPGTGTRVSVIFDKDRVVPV